MKKDAYFTMRPGYEGYYKYILILNVLELKFSYVIMVTIVTIHMLKNLDLNTRVIRGRKWAQITNGKNIGPYG